MSRKGVEQQFLRMAQNLHGYDWGRSLEKGICLMNILLKFAVPIVAAASITGAANAVVVAGVYNTGVGLNGTPLPLGNGQIDPHYSVVSSTIGTVLPGSSALTYYNINYLQDGPDSRIVNFSGDGMGVTGSVTTFATTFSLAGYDFANATLSGQALADNSLNIFLNGNQVGGTIAGFKSLTPFGANGSFFIAGVNTLSFTLSNVAGPAAFQVAGLTVTAAAVPEPSSWVLLVAGFGMVGVSLRRRKMTKVVSS